jgi:hypothetical protein
MWCLDRIALFIAFSLSISNEYPTSLALPPRGEYTTRGTPTIQHQRAGTLALPCRQYHRTTRLSTCELLDGSPFSVVRSGASGSARLRWQFPAVYEGVFVMSDQNFSQSIRSKIVPFSAVKQKPTQYETSWAGLQTFEQIYENLAHYVSNVMKRNGFRPHEIPECLQMGFMVLWETLTQQPDFLAQKTRQKVVFFVLARCKISSLRYGEGRYDSYEALTSDDWHSTADEHAITGLEANRDERWAAWATDVDIRADIERIMCKLAEKYGHSLKHMIALYHLTTQVSRIDAAKIVGAEPFRWHQRYAQPVLQDLRYEFAEVFLESHDYALVGEVEMPEERQKLGRFSSPYTNWRDQYEQGNTAPADALLERYRGTVCVAGAIRAQLEGKTYRQAALDIGRNPKTFPRYMKRAARMLAAAYS